MARSRYDDLWSELERRLRSLVSDLAGSLPDEGRWSLEMIDHNEFGEALEAIRLPIIEERIAIPNEVAEELVQIAELMKIETYESELRALAH
jgi:hypothetical protein